MSPHAETYLLECYTDRKSRLVVMPKRREYLTQQTFERMAKALRIPLTSAEQKEMRRG